MSANGSQTLQRMYGSYCAFSSLALQMAPFGCATLEYFHDWDFDDG